MVTINLEVSEEIAKKFENKKFVKYDEIIDYDKSLHYNFSDEKVSLKELSDFLGDVISSKNEKKC